MKNFAITKNWRSSFHLKTDEKQMTNNENHVSGIVSFHGLANAPNSLLSKHKKTFS